MAKTITPYLHQVMGFFVLVAWSSYMTLFAADRAETGQHRKTLTDP